MILLNIVLANPGIKYLMLINTLLKKPRPPLSIVESPAELANFLNLLTDQAGAGNSFDCGTSVAPLDEEMSCGEQNPSFKRSTEDKQCLWHFYVGRLLYKNSI